MGKSNVTAAKPKVGGAVSVAPIGTAMPTDATTALDKAFESLGYISDEGLKNNGSITTESIKAWGGDVVLTPQTEKSDAFSATFIEGLNLAVLKFVHNDENVEGDLATGITVKANSLEHKPEILVADMIMAGGVLKRIVIPCGVIISVDEITYGDSSAVGYAVTVAAQPDDELNTHYEYIKSAS